MVEEIKKDFPILSQSINGHPLCYLDSAASAQKPQAVIDAVNDIMLHYYSNVHRGAHTLASKSTIAYEGARAKVAKFINAKSENEIVFTRSATASINLVASSFGESLKEGDEIILSELEHHANIVPWYFLQEKKGIKLKIIPISDNGDLDLQEFEKLLSPKTKLVAISQMSNVLGGLTPIKEIVQKAHQAGAKVLIDGSQGVVHHGVDVQDVDCDFYVFTGHKLYALTGIGVLYGKEDLLNSMPPYQGGGDMIERVSFEKITYKNAPNRFEAGTPPIIEAVSLSAAIDYLSKFNRQELIAHEKELLNAMEDGLEKLGEIKMFNKASNRCGILSFNIEGVHHQDAATVMDKMGVAVRSGLLCAEPLMHRLKVQGTVRASLAMYNDMNDIERFVESVYKAKKMLS